MLEAKPALLLMLDTDELLIHHDEGRFGCFWEIAGGKEELD